jgi:hypothetical protein
MPRLLIDAWKRIERARTHGLAFKAECERIINPATYTTVPEMNSDWTRGTIKAVTNVVSKNDIALELGELFYQLRAALDAAVYQVAVMQHGSEPPPDENRIEFPICPTPEAFNRNPINKPPFPQPLRDWLETIQPYNTAKTEALKYSALNRKLEIVHDCARKDRHRRLHIVAAVPTALDWEFKIEGPGHVTFVNPLPANFLENECVFLEFGFEGSTKTETTNIKMATAIAIEVAFPEVPVPAGGNLGSELAALIYCTEFVLQYFESGYS